MSFFSNPLSAFKTLKSIDSVSLIVMDKERFQQLQEHFDQRDNQACLDKEYNKDIMDATRNLVSRDLAHDQPSLVVSSIKPLVVVFMATTCHQDHLDSHHSQDDLPHIMRKKVMMNFLLKPSCALNKIKKPNT